jgi:hypothetical protein
VAPTGNQVTGLHLLSTEQELQRRPNQGNPQGLRRGRD